MTLVISDNTGAVLGQATEDDRVEAITTIYFDESEQLRAFFKDVNELAEKLRKEYCPMVSDEDIIEEAFDEMVKRYGYAAKEMEL